MRTAALCFSVPAARDARIVRGDEAAGGGHEAQEPEVVAADEEPLGAPGLAAGGDAGAEVPVAGQVGEARMLTNCLRVGVAEELPARSRRSFDKAFEVRLDVCLPEQHISADKYRGCNATLVRGSSICIVQSTPNTCSVLVQRLIPPDDLDGVVTLEIREE